MKIFNHPVFLFTVRNYALYSFIALAITLISTTIILMVLFSKAKAMEQIHIYTLNIYMYMDERMHFIFSTDHQGIGGSIIYTDLAMKTTNVIMYGGLCDKVNIG